MKKCFSRQPRRRFQVQTRAEDGALSRFFITLLANGGDLNWDTHYGSDNLRSLDAARDRRRA